MVVLDVGELAFPQTLLVSVHRSSWRDFAAARALDLPATVHPRQILQPLREDLDMGDGCPEMAE